MGTQDSVAKGFGAEKLVDFTQQSRLIDRLAGKLGASFSQALGSFTRGVALR